MLEFVLAIKRNLQYQELGSETNLNILTEVNRDKIFYLCTHFFNALLIIREIIPLQLALIGILRMGIWKYG